MKIIAVRIGDRYGPEYETYLESKLPEYEFIWIREPIRSDVVLQWNKMYGMNLDIDEPVCVMDIDVLLVGEYKKVFKYPIKQGEFLAMPGWWRDTNKEKYKINGGFFKYYPKDCKYIYDEFMSNTDKWQRYYIDNGITNGPVNGEQYFVEDHVRQKLKLKLLPNAWFTRWMSSENNGMTEKQYRTWQYNITKKYCDLTGNDYLFMGDFHSDIKFIHFTHMLNKPHSWKHYSEYT
jgi:hypothetical protein